MAEDVRVILVGRTGLEGALRLDPGMELLRARTAIEAIAEAADPIDDDSPEVLAVIVGPDIDLGQHASAFVRSIRTIDPGARVLGVAGQAASMPDGMVDPDEPSHSIRVAIRGAAQPAESAREPTSAGSEAVAASLLKDLDASRETNAPSHSWDADSQLVETLLHGVDPMPVALDIARRHCGIPELVVVHRKPDAGGVPLVVGNKTFGWLLGGGQEPRVSEDVVQWLAGWLALHTQQRQLKEAAFKDDLTGVWNRRYFNHFLEAAINEARERRQGSVTLLYFDIDEFKSYNDRFGHAAGDEILVETCKLMMSMVRPTDRVCRIGGDEFVVVFHEPGPKRDPLAPPPSNVAEIAQRYQEAICEQRFPKLSDDAPGTLTISGGLATFPWDGQTPQELLERADMLTIDSKRKGKNVITLGPGAQSHFGIG